MTKSEPLNFLFPCNSMQYLNTNTTLYNAILKAESEGVMLTEEARRAATTLRVDFEKGGIHLPKGWPTRVILVLLVFHLSVAKSIISSMADKLEHVNHLNLEIAQLGRK